VATGRGAPVILDSLAATFPLVAADELSDPSTASTGDRVTLDELERTIVSATRKIYELRGEAWQRSPAGTPIEAAVRGVAQAIGEARVVVDAALLNSRPGRDTTAEEVSGMLMVASKIIEHLLLRLSPNQSVPSAAGSHKRFRRLLAAVDGIGTNGDARLLALRTLHAAAQADPKTWEGAAHWLCIRLSSYSPSVNSGRDFPARWDAAKELIAVWAAVAEGSTVPKWKPTNEFLRRFGLAANSTDALEHVWATRDPR